MLVPSIGFIFFRTGNIEHLRLLDAPLDELRAGLNSGLVTSVDLVRANIAQVEEVNPLVHVVNEMNPEIVFTTAAGKANVSQRAGVARHKCHSRLVSVRR